MYTTIKVIKLNAISMYLKLKSVMFSRSSMKVVDYIGRMEKLNCGNLITSGGKYKSTNVCMPIGALLTITKSNTKVKRNLKINNKNNIY
jgi:hypothetical protein